jgi:hypothetical protein
MPFGFIHSADLHLGRRFGNLPEDVRGRLVEARHQIIASLAQVARDQGAQHILIAGDIFDTETPTDPVWRQAVAAMGADPALQWWLIPGNHDSLAAESLWSRFRRHATANVHLIDEAAPVEIAPDVVLLPAPLPRRYTGRDLTAWMPDCSTDPRQFRIGLAHGAVRDFSESGNAADGIIAPDRAENARLDYLALGDWHARDRANLALATAIHTHADLSDAAPDLAQADATLSRALSVVAGADEEIATLSMEGAGLDREIDLRSGEGVAEDLADVSTRLSTAQSRRDLLLFEVAVLKTLIAALETARNTARERYFAPVMAELRPLLHLLWPDAELKFDGESLLPTALVRNGREEDIGILSGGTQEQIALFVRLAFARLLARSGRHAPVILDDALVYTDDDRIERVFDVLHGQANDLQIIVLTCRRRAFRALGGQKLTFLPV